MNKGRWFILLILGSLLLVSCRTLEKKAVRSVADMLSSPDGAGAITSDDDPQLIADALPLALKIYEILLAQDPKNDELAAATGKNFAMYSGGFILLPADMMDDEMWEEAAEARSRAKKLFRRGRDYLLSALDLRHEGFLSALDSGDYDTAAAMLETEDADAAYWAGLAWLGMASTDPLDVEVLTTVDKAALLMYRSMELDDSPAGIHDMMIQLQVSLPSSVLATMRERSPLTANYMDGYYESAGIGTNPRDRAVFHFERAVSLSNGLEPSPYITMASAVSVKEQDVESFRTYLNAALAIDPEENPDTRLMTLIYQDKAQWLLDHIEEFFLVDF